MKLTMLVPVRNEGLNVRILVKVLRSLMEVPYEVLVIVDSPDDRTVPMVNRLREEDKNVRLVVNDQGRGVANALRAGVRAAKGEVLLILAADEVGPLIAIEDMLALIGHGCDFVSCTRYRHGGRRLGGSVIGGTLSRLANWLFHRVSGSVLSDCTSGMKMFRRGLWDRMELSPHSVGWAIAFEMSIRAQLLGARLGEVPVVSIDRLYGGESTFRLGPWFWYYLGVFLRGTKALRNAPGTRPTVQVRDATYFKEVSDQETIIEEEAETRVRHRQQRRRQ